MRAASGRLCFAHDHICFSLSRDRCRLSPHQCLCGRLQSLLRSGEVHAFQVVGSGKTLRRGTPRHSGRAQFTMATTSRAPCRCAWQRLLLAARVSPGVFGGCLPCPDHLWGRHGPVCSASLCHNVAQGLTSGAQLPLSSTGRSLFCSCFVRWEVWRDAVPSQREASERELVCPVRGSLLCFRLRDSQIPQE